MFELAGPDDKWGGYFLDYPRLYELADQKRAEYQQGSPFPHIVLDGFLPPWLLDAVIGEFPDAEKELQRRDNSFYIDGQPIQHKKVGIQSDKHFSALLRHFIWELNSWHFLQFLERLTGIDHLLADPLYRGGGLHQTKPGGMLQIHADFNKHPIYGLDRRLNLLIYLNKDWQDDWGGDLELWSKDMTRCEKSVLPVAGRCVVFSTSSDSWHGHPKPVACPEGNTRKSLALYFYTNGRPEAEDRPAHKVLWQLPKNTGGGSQS